MLAAIITLSLLSLLVATEADSSDSRHEHRDEPLRPPGKRGEQKGGDGKPGRLAA